MTGTAALLGCGRQDSPSPGLNLARSTLATRLPALDGRAAGSRFKLGLSAYSFRKDLEAGMSLQEFIDYCAEQNLDGVELTSYYFANTDREYLCDLRRRATVNGLCITGTPVGNTFCLPPGPERDREIQHVQQWIDHAATLGAQTVRIFGGEPPAGVTVERALEWTVQSCRKVAEFAAQRGVILGLENHGGITSTARQLSDIIELVDSPWLGINLDSGNFKEQSYHQMEQVAALAVTCQVKAKLIETHGEKSAADFARILRILRDAEFRGPVLLEYEGPDQPREAVPPLLKALREAMA
jgi:sugar phosphate isomerase/epimerase